MQEHLKDKSFVDYQRLQYTWAFISQQARQFDVWFGLCGLVGIFGLLFSCFVVMTVAAAISLLAIVNPIALASFGGALSLAIDFFIGILVLILLGKFLVWGFGFFNAIAVNSLDAARGVPLRRFQNRVTGFVYFMSPIVYFLIICIGLSFFIVPGIVFAVRFSLARYVVLDKGGTLWDSLMTSWDITRGYFWTLLLMYGILFVCYMIPFMFLIDLFFPISNLCMASLYVQLQQRQLTPEIVPV